MRAALGYNVLSPNVITGERKGKGGAPDPWSYISVARTGHGLGNWLLTSGIILAPCFSSVNLPLGILGSLAENVPCPEVSTICSVKDILLQGH